MNRFFQNTFSIGAFCMGITLFATPEVDRYGQFTKENWPTKVTSDLELKADLEQEKAKLANVDLNLNKVDQYGGVKLQNKYNATGFFRVDKIDNKWWIISPEGNLFYLKGVDAIPYNERGYFTAAYNASGDIRPFFTEGIPSINDYPDAWRNNELVNFLAANLQRKYGTDFKESWMDLTKKRLLDWGFNASGKWNNPFVFDRLPFILDAGLDVKRIDRYIDPYDSTFEPWAEKTIKELGEKYCSDPYLIGYQFENENGWSRSTPILILNDKSGTLAAKKALLDFLADENEKNPGEIFNKPELSVTDLMKEALDGTQLPQNQLYDFVRKTSKLYYKTLNNLVKKYDKNHIFLGASHCSAQSIEWIEGSVEYVDIIPLHEYNLNSQWINKTLANKLTEWDKPFAVLEFSFTNTRRGFGTFSNSIKMDTEADRGHGFSYYSEQLAKNPLCVGTSYFILYDQPVTSRGHDAEAFNFGLIDVVDRPYKEMLDLVKDANKKLFDIHAGTMEPTAQKPKLSAEDPYKDFMPDSLGEVRLDSSNTQFHHNRINRIRFSDNSRFGVPLTVGTFDAGKSGGFKTIELYVFLWKNIKNRDLNEWFKLEESADNINFTPVESQFKLYRDGTFPEYIMSPKLLKADTQYVKLLFVMHNPASPWASSLAEIKIEHK